ncbi:hypothetical protein DSM104443_02843 [Usitatibacter rugosus]|uniref:Lipoprotein n=1 Tax=Usitatibacter rugosus TaxID=2732067 RepID=A0A6M4GWW4_9PROT|nr:hypothetical protein [Usitatibacter rugosus]QJR11760.1 hypothetical protein DSM104443_02843 [Usitatibacter rugosus]
MKALAIALAVFLAGCSTTVNRLYDGDLPNSQVAILVSGGSSHPEIKEALYANLVTVDGEQCSSISAVMPGKRGSCTGIMLVRAGPIALTGRIETRKTMAGDLYKWREGTFESTDTIEGGHLSIFEVVPQGKGVAVAIRKVCRSADLVTLAARMKAIWPQLQAKVAAHHVAHAPVFECESALT